MYRHHPVERPSSPPPLGDPTCSYPWHPPPSSTQHQASPSEPSSVNGSPTPTQQQMFISSNNQTYQPFPVHHHYHTQVPPRPKLSTTLWEDEGTLCYQVDAKGICVARRQDNDMVNGTKLLNVAGMSRGKRDGILKNEKGRVVVKVGAMHLKGVWITFARAKMLAVQYKIADALYPLFVDDPSMFLYPNGGPSRVTAISGAFRPFGAFNASASSPSSLPAPPGGNWDRPTDYLNRVSTSQGFRPPSYSHHDLPSSDENLYLENNSSLDYRTDDNAVGGMVSQQQNQSHPSHNYGQLYTPYHQHSPESPFVDQSRYAHQRETSQDIMLEQRRRDFNNNNNFRPPQPRHVDDIPPFTSPIHMPSGKASQFETAGAGGAGGGGVYNEENNVLETATSSRSSSPGSRHQLQQQQQTPYQQQAVRLISPSAVTMSPPTPRADMPSHYFEESPTSPYHHRRESAIFDTPQRVASPRHHPYAPKPASSGKVFQQSSIANRLEEKKTSEELVEQQIPTSLTNQNAMENHHPSW